MNNENYTNPNLLDNLLYYLNNPDIKDGKKTTFTTDIWNLGSKLATTIGRSANKAFSDGVWYNEAKAQQLLLDFINNSEVQKSLKPQHKKIMEIYDRLAHLSHKGGTWADGVDKELLLGLGPQTEKEDIETPDLIDLIDLIITNPFLPDTSEEKTFEAQTNIPIEAIADPSGTSYAFTPIKGIIPPTNRMLFHIQADEFGKASQLEGGNSAESVKYLHQFLSASKTPCPQEILAELNNAVNLAFDSKDQTLHSYTSAFDGLHVALNVLEWIDKSGTYKLLGSRRIPFHHLLIKNSKVTLLTQVEASLYRNDPNYYNLTFGFNDPKKKPTQDEQFKIVKLKFLNGESQFTPDECKLLQLWFKNQGSKKMQKLYLEHILTGFPKKAARYQGSALQDLFAKDHN